ncbi:MAG TPA: hypothetical protein VNJ51_06715 [Candidatus Dormibacteraeota bacterium]|nr:hypothetical protein [Candidatus Dormibacteraeota bacterium]
MQRLPHVVNAVGASGYGADVGGDVGQSLALAAGAQLARQLDLLAEGGVDQRAGVGVVGVFVLGGLGRVALSDDVLNGYEQPPAMKHLSAIAWITVQPAGILGVPNRA